ncbi:phosphate-selective porin OprO/OprP [Lysobacter enzymogenes]|uniref:OprO/OprP family phosphate-selective porin n=1 Tax=Lysobacter enzymogenes TaxID=69 RepID=UPI00346E256E
MTNRFRPHPIALATLIAAAGASGEAAAQTPDSAELLRLVQAQAERIERLERRLAAVEGGAAAADAPKPAPAAEAAGAAARLDKLEQVQARQPTVNWSKGAPQFASADGRSVFRPRGRVFLDASSTGGSRFAGRDLSGTEVRSLRLGAEGAYGRIGWNLEGDFADNGVSWKSAYVSFAHTVFGQKSELTVGNRLNDRGLDGSSSTSNTPFQERNVVGTLVLPQRGLFGVGLTERVFGRNWHASLSAAGNDLDNAGDGNDSLTWAARAHWNPIKRERALVHLGAWAFHEDIAAGSAGVVRAAAIGGHFNDEVKIAPGSVVGAERGRGHGVELATVAGPFWASGEWGRRRIEGRDRGGRYGVGYDAHAVSAGWFLGGGAPAYGADNGTWGRVKVERPVTAGGRGAWELKARYENADFRDLPGGGAGNAWTVGANWYLNDYSRVMLDLVRWQTDNRSGKYLLADDGYTFNTRLQLVF